ncbi:MAG TPA: hypothetical protein VNF99_09515 [Stellaceae bacterium]|nr:hypothetical protein [Stellaceae bacterium]
MPFALNLYHDQIGAEGATSAALPAAPRLLYVRHGRVAINGQALGADEAIYCDAPVALQSTGAWSQVWRWDLALPNAAPLLHRGEGVLSQHRMARIISTLHMPAASRWLLRLDQINAPAGRIADRHQHPGPGIRCLLEGSFNVQQDAESVRDVAPGEAWWETGSDTVVAWGSAQMATRFMRGMILPVECAGKPTGTWLSGEAASASARGNWKLYVDRIVTV